MDKKLKKTDNEIHLKEHSFDGIQEYDQNLPNWWLWTFYLAIIFSLAYWLFMYTSDGFVTDDERISSAFEEIEAKKIAQAGDYSSDEALFKMSEMPQFVEAGKITYMTNCVACHGANLEGGIGFNLADAEWVHGGSPVDIFHTIEVGVIEKGMQPWGPTLGAKKIAEVVAFILDHNKTDQ